AGLELNGTEASTGTTYKVKLENPFTNRPNQHTVTSTSTTSRGERRTVRARVDSFNVWDFEFSGAGTSTAGANGSLEGNVSLHGPFYSRGDLVMSGSTELHVGPIYVKNSPNLGASTCAVQNGAAANLSGNFCASGSGTAGDPNPAVADCFTLTKGPLDMFAEGRVLQNTSGNPASWNFPPDNQGQVVEQTSV